MAITCALWWFGCAFLVQSANAKELLLNAVALIFVLDIDDDLFFILPEMDKQYLPARSPPLSIMGDMVLVKRPVWSRGLILLCTDDLVRRAKGLCWVRSYRFFINTRFIV